VQLGYGTTLFCFIINDIITVVMFIARGLSSLTTEAMPILGESWVMSPPNPNYAYPRRITSAANLSHHNPRNFYCSNSFIHVSSAYTFSYHEELWAATIGEANQALSKI
jgi:hypothetical protein